MLLTGIGSALGKAAGRLKSPQTVFVLAQVLVAVVPIGEIFLLRTMRNVVFVRGSEVGVTETVVTCCVLLAPYCVILGYLLTLASWLLQRTQGLSEKAGECPVGCGRRSEAHEFLAFCGGSSLARPHPTAFRITSRQAPR